MKKTRRLARKERLRWELRLYIADSSPRSKLAVGNLRRLCEQHLKTQYRITIVDIVRQPSMACAHNILATPTLVRVLPPKRIRRSWERWQTPERCCKRLEFR